MSAKRVRFDPTPVLAQFPPGTTAAAISSKIGLSPAAVDHYRHGRRLMHPAAADKAATRLGLHPSLLWPDWYTAQERCGNGHLWADTERFFSCTPYRKCSQCRTEWDQRSRAAKRRQAGKGST